MNNFRAPHRKPAQSVIVGAALLLSGIASVTVHAAPSFADDAENGSAQVKAGSAFQSPSSTSTALSAAQVNVSLNRTHAGVLAIAPNDSSVDRRRSNGVIPLDVELAEREAKYTTEDKSTVPALAKVDSTKTLADLKAVEAWSPLDPQHYLAQGTFATRDITNAPRLELSKKIAEYVSNLPKKFEPEKLWWQRTGFNLGGDGEHQIGYYDNIPIYTVDSSNPYQNFVTMTSDDRRSTTFSKLMEMNAGKIPLPTWAIPSKGGDHSFAIYDKGTGIFRGYFGVSAVEGKPGEFRFASSGYWYGDFGTDTAGMDNYFLGYIQGGSSVIGVSNELTQIGKEEVKNGEIDHTISMTFPSYKADSISFPAKGSDGRLHDDLAPSAGQIFTFPKDMDVDKWAVDNGRENDRVLIMIMKAIQKHGGLISDQNAFAMAFNFESPYGMGGTAEQGLNGWKEDPETAALMAQFRPNNFPWELTEWLPTNYAHVEYPQAVATRPIPAKTVVADKVDAPGATELHPVALPEILDVDSKHVSPTVQSAVAEAPVSSNAEATNNVAVANGASSTSESAATPVETVLAQPVEESGSAVTPATPVLEAVTTDAAKTEAISEKPATVNTEVAPVVEEKSETVVPTTAPLEEEKPAAFVPAVAPVEEEKPAALVPSSAPVEDEAPTLDPATVTVAKQNDAPNNREITTRALRESANNPGNLIIDRGVKGKLLVETTPETESVSGDPEADRQLQMDAAEKLGNGKSVVVSSERGNLQISR